MTENRNTLYIIVVVGLIIYTMTIVACLLGIFSWQVGINATFGLIIFLSGFIYIIKYQERFKMPEIASSNKEVTDQIEISLWAFSWLAAIFFIPFALFFQIPVVIMIMDRENWISEPNGLMAFSILGLFCLIFTATELMILLTKFEATSDYYYSRSAITKHRPYVINIYFKNVRTITYKWKFIKIYHSNGTSSFFVWDDKKFKNFIKNKTKEGFE